MGFDDFQIQTTKTTISLQQSINLNRLYAKVRNSMFKLSKKGNFCLNRAVKLVLNQKDNHNLISNQMKDRWMVNRWCLMIGWILGEGLQQQLIKYNCMEEDPAAPPSEKTPEQLEEELRQRQEEQRVREEERKRAEEEARIKAEEDLKKLEEALKGGLSGLAKTANNRSVAYLRLSIAEKEIERLFPVMLRFRQVRYLDLNTNAIADLSLVAQFPNLLWLNASKNQASSLAVFAEEGLENLQFLNLSGNKIKELTPIAVPALRRLNLSQNEISQVSWKGHNGIQILELRKNKLRKLKGISNMKALKQLYVCENELTDIRGLEALPQLQKLSVRNNKLKGLYSPFPFLPNLTYLNLRENQISKLQELKKVDLHVTGINLLQNPASDELGENLKKEAVYLMPHLTRVNKSDVTIEERVAFEKEMLEKLAERERQRLAQEEEARRAQEEKAE